MSIKTPARVLVLHALRIKGMADATQVATRYGLDREAVEEQLLDDEAIGLVQRVGFGDLAAWSLTERGRTEDQRLLSDELDEHDLRSALADAHVAFLALNARLLETITRWQIRPVPWDAMAANDHEDWAWDQRVLDELASLGRRLRPISDDLSNLLGRFGGYHHRYTAALQRVDAGARKWVDEPRVDSCHTVWFELHEDLLSTLGRSRESEA